MTLYGANGQINTTSVAGSSYTGLLAADGSYNIVINDGTALKGLHHPCGAFNAVITTNSAAGFYAPNGSMNIIANGSSPSGYSPVQPSGSNSGGSGPLTFLRVATTLNSGFNANGFTAGVATTDFAFRVPVQIAQDCSQLVLSFNTWGLGNGGDTTVGNTVTIVDCAIDSGTATSGVTFSGSTSVVISDNTVDFKTDPINPPTGKTRFTKGEIYFVKTHTNVPASGKMPYALNVPGSSVSGWQSYNFNPLVTSITAAATPGLFTTIGVAPGVLGPNFKPIVLGFPYVDQLSLLAVGDSEIAGLTDTGGATLLNGAGYFQRGMTDSDGVSNPFPSMNFSLSGQGTPAMSGTNIRWTNFCKYANTGVSTLNTNDIGAATTFNAAYSLAQTIPKLMRDKGMKRLIRTELFPNTTDAIDNFATVANQTEQTNWTPGAVASQIITSYNNHLIDKLYQAVVPATNLRDGTVPTKWIANGSAFFATPDGKHPSTAFHAIQGAQVNTVVKAFPNSDPTPSVLPPVLNPYDKNSNITLSNGNLTAINTTTATQSDVRCTTPVTVSDPLKYFEVLINNSTGVGILLSNLKGDLSTANNADILTYNSNGGVFFNGQITPGLPTFSTGNVVCIALDMSNLRLAARINGGNWNGNVANDPAVSFIDLSGTTRFNTTNQIYPGIGLPSLNGSVTMVFSGFSFSVPSGYSAITGGGV